MMEYIYMALIFIGALILVAVSIDAIHQKENAEARRELLEALGWADKDKLARKYKNVMEELDGERKS